MDGYEFICGFGPEDYPNETYRSLLERHSTRKFEGRPLERGDLAAIVEAGLRAPSAGGAQACTLLVSNDAALNLRLGRVSRSLYDEGPYRVSDVQPSIADDPAMPDAFYGAPTVVTVFTPKGWSYAELDAATCATYLMVAAESLGVGSCFVSRARRTFETPEGLAQKAAAGVPEDYEATCHVVLGYPASAAHNSKPLYPGRLFFVEQEAPWE